MYCVNHYQLGVIGLNSFRYKFIVMESSKFGRVNVISNSKDFIALAKLYLILDNNNSDRNHILFEKERME